MLDLQGTLIVIGVVVLAAILLMITVRPNPRRYRRIGLGQTGTARPSSAQQPNQPSEEPQQALDQRRAESA